LDWYAKYANRKVPFGKNIQVAIRRLDIKVFFEAPYNHAVILALHNLEMRTFCLAMKPLAK